MNANPQQQNNAPRRTAGSTVTVACKHPHGLILRLFKMVDVEEAQTGGGFRTVKRAQPDLSRGTVTINGYLTALKGLPVQPIAPTSTYALTHNVPADFWEEWIRQNKDHPMVLNKLIYAHENANMAPGFAREHEKQACGLEPVDPNKKNSGIQTYTPDAA